MPKLAMRRPPSPPSTSWLKILPEATRFAFHGGSDARATASPIWGAEFSEDACRANVHSTRATLWLGPDEYLLLDTHIGDSQPTFDSLELALQPVPHALVDISHRQFGVGVTGPQAAAILTGACPLDLDIRAFPVGMCTRTVLAKADIVLWRTREAEFHLEVWRSFAGYVAALLAEIASGL